MDTITGENTDATLVAMSRNGNTDAFGDLVRRYQCRVYGVVSRMISDRDEVDDIVQDVFVLAYKSMPSFRGDSSFSTWVCRIAVNVTIKAMKKRKTRHAASIDDPAAGLSEVLVSSDADRPDIRLENRAKSAALREAIETLPEYHRAVVVLHYLRNCTCEEIAEIMQCSVGTVWSRLHYACKKLQGRLGWLAGEGKC